MHRPANTDTPEQQADDGIEFVSPGKYSIHNPPARQQATDGGSPSTLFLDSQDEVCRHSQQLMQQARHIIRIYSVDLEPWLYDNDSVAQLCKNLLLQHENNRLHILLQDSRTICLQGHRLLSLAERLSSRLLIRLTHPEHETFPGQWLSVDGEGLLLRKTSSPCQGHIFYHQPSRVRPYIEQFDNMWSLSRTDINLRRMPL